MKKPSTFIDLSYIQMHFLFENKDSKSLQLFHILFAL